MAPSSAREIRILLLGDDGVGKSTLITTLIKETFIEQIQHVVPEVTIPPEWTRENATTRIVDSSARPENRDQLDSEIRKADVICIVYSIDRRDTIERVSLFWLPYIRKLGRNVPVVLVGNKIDSRSQDMSNVTLEEQVMPIMNEFKEVETCVECSAKASLNVSEVFYFAQKAVLHPTAPLYDSREHVLKPACISALRRIFKLCDVDKNNFLNDAEIDNFQRKCFGAPLQRHELESVKAVVRQNEPDGVTEAGLSEIGFIFLHTLFIQRGRLETTWTVLRTFGYGDDLTLREDFLFPPIEVPSDSSVELSSDGYQFLTDLHQIFDKDNDGALNQQELDALFSTAPYIPWEGSGVQSITNHDGSLTLQGFLAQWSMTTLLNYKTTLAYFAYLGFPDKDTTKGLKVTRSKKIDLKKGKVQRDVFLSYVFGAAGSGKTTVLKSFINQDFSDSYIPTTTPFSVVNSVEIRGAEKYLVMQEFGPAFDAEVLQNKKKLDACDLICMVYDSADTNSFAYVAGLREKYHLDDLPVVFIATKSDLDLVAQRFTAQPDAYCRSLGLVVPMSVSIKSGGASKDLFHMLVGVCMNPSIAIIPKSPFSSKNKNFLTAFTATAVSVCVLAVIVGVCSQPFAKLLQDFKMQASSDTTSLMTIERQLSNILISEKEKESTTFSASSSHSLYDIDIPTSDSSETLTGILLKKQSNSKMQTCVTSKSGPPPASKSVKFASFTTTTAATLAPSFRCRKRIVAHEKFRYMQVNPLASYPSTSSGKSSSFSSASSSAMSVSLGLGRNSSSSSSASSMLIPATSTKGILFAGRFGDLSPSAATRIRMKKRTSSSSRIEKRRRSSSLTHRLGRKEEKDLIDHFASIL